jgi:hypothetical protein
VIGNFSSVSMSLEHQLPTNLSPRQRKDASFLSKQIDQCRVSYSSLMVMTSNCQVAVPYNIALICFYLSDCKVRRQINISLSIRR